MFYLVRYFFLLELSKGSYICLWEVGFICEIVVDIPCVSDA